MQDWQAVWQLVTSPNGLGLLGMGTIICACFCAGFMRQQRLRWEQELSACQKEQRNQLEDLHQLQWRLEESEDALALQRQQSLKFEQQLRQNQGIQLNNERELAAAKAKLTSDREHFTEQLALLKQAETRLVETFQRAAQEIFEAKTERFTEQNQQQLAQLLNPFQSQLQTFGKLVQESQQYGRTQHAVLEKELGQLRQLNHKLSQEAHQLVEALRGDVKIMGHWGELKLERLLKLSGLNSGQEYELQASIRDPHNGQLYRPDALIKLPDGQCLIIDAKVSLEHYQRYLAADSSQDKQQAIKLHLQSIRQHMRGLAQKEYQLLDALGSPEFVFMFVPSEPAYLEALQADERLLIEAQAQNIVLLSPANLLATLKTVASLWNLWRRNEHALDIAKRAGLLYDKFVGFSTNLSEIGQRLDQAKQAYERGVNQLSQGPGNIVRQVEQLKALGARTAKQLDNEWLEKSTDDLEQPDSFKK